MDEMKGGVVLNGGKGGSEMGDVMYMGGEGFS